MANLLSEALFLCIFSSPEPKAHWCAYRIGRPPSSVRCPHSLNIFSSETTGPIEAKFHMESPLDGGTIVCSNGPGHMTRMAAMPIYGKNLKKIFFSGIKRPMTLKLGMQHRVLKCYQVLSIDDPGLVLTYFMARSNLVPYAFVWENGKTTDFPETIVVYDLKLATDDRSDKKFLLTSKLCPLGAVCPLPRGYIPVLNHEKKKKCIKSDFKEVSLKLATNG